MAKKNLTDAFCKTATSGGKPQADYYDQSYPGLCLRVSNTRKSWTFLFTAPQDGARARFTMGTYPNITLEAARVRYRELEAMVRAGKDPRKVEIKPEELTIRQIVAKRMAESRRIGFRAVDEIERILTANVLPVVGDMPIREFRRRHLNQIIEPILARGSLVAANRTVQQMRATLNFAVEIEEIDFNPIAKTKWNGNRVPTPEKPRERWLTLAEIKSVWADADRVLGRDARTGKRTPTIIKLCLATGQRLGEVCGMTRSELDMVKREWTIPADRCKNGREHILPLNDLAMMLIGERLRQTNGELLFPMHNDRDRPVPVEAIGNNVRYGHEDGMWGKMPAWTPHDLRRTVATWMERDEDEGGLGVNSKHISFMLNHTVKDTITEAVYIVNNQHLPEKRRAADKWGRFLAKLVGVELEEREAA